MVASIHQAATWKLFAIEVARGRWTEACEDRVNDVQAQSRRIHGRSRDDFISCPDIMPKSASAPVIEFVVSTMATQEPRVLELQPEVVGVGSKGAAA
jgi:hypothetical protein